MVVEAGGDADAAEKKDRRGEPAEERGLDRELELRLCCDAAEATAETFAQDRLRALAAAAAAPAREPPTRREAGAEEEKDADVVAAPPRACKRAAIAVYSATNCYPFAHER